MSDQTPNPTVTVSIVSRWDASRVLFAAEVDASIPVIGRIKAALTIAVGARANLADADLAGANLAGADLARAYLADANLAGANLAGADLARAYLADANLAGANLAGADLAGANLARANLADANLADADLAGADLAGADLARADLAGADLADADLAGANLAGANLARANLADAKWRNGITLRRAPLMLYGLDYPVIVLDDHLQIGCELHTIAEWSAFDNERIARMDGVRARRFWDRHKAVLLALAASDGRGTAPAAQTEEAA